MARSYPSPGGEIWHLSNAGPGKWTFNRESQSVELQWSPGGLALLLAPTALREAKRGREVHWLATPSTPYDREKKRFNYPEDYRPEEIRKADPRSVDVRFQSHITDELFDNYYKVFSNTALWMTMHGRPHELSDEQLRAAWADYKQVNELFAKTVIKRAGEGATVVVHDFQLLLTPQLIKAARPDLDVTGYLHVPFAKPNEFLQSLSGSDQMGLPDDIGTTIVGSMNQVPWGFHSDRWVENYEKCLYATLPEAVVAQSKYAVPGFLDPKRLHNLAQGMTDEEFTERGREIVVDGIIGLIEGGDPIYSSLPESTIQSLIDGVNELEGPALSQRGFQLAREEFADLESSRHPIVNESVFDRVLTPLRTNYNTYKELMKQPRRERGQIITMVGRGDPKNGILNGLRAYRALIADETIAIKPSMLLVCSQTRPGVPAYDKYWQEIKNEVRAIQDLRNSNLVHFDGEPYAVTLAAQLVADIALVPSERGGRDLVAIEPVGIRGPEDKPVVVIVSDGAAASETLSGASVVRNVGPPPFVARRAHESLATFTRRAELSAAGHQASVVSNLAKATKEILFLSDKDFNAAFEKERFAASLENQPAWMGRMQAEARGHVLPQVARGKATIGLTD